MKSITNPKPVERRAIENELAKINGQLELLRRWQELLADYFKPTHH